MASLRKHIKRVMSTKLTEKTMELLIGLNEKNEQRLRAMTLEFSKKLVKEYFRAIKKQNKTAVKARTKKQRESNGPIAYLEPSLIAS